MPNDRITWFCLLILSIKLRIEINSSYERLSDLLSIWNKKYLSGNILEKTS